MKLLCECGHPNHVHFAGTRACHAVDLDETWTPVVVEGEGPKGDRIVHCDCPRFVAAQF